MNQDTTTPPQNHPWVTASTPNNLRDPQLLQDLSEIGMTCLLGWHALMDTPHSYAAESVWYGKAKTWAEELERLYLTYTQGDDWMSQFPAPQLHIISQADADMSRAYGMLFWNNPMPDGSDPKTAITQRLLSAHNIIRHLVKGEGGLPYGRLPRVGEPEFLAYDPDAERWVAGRGIEDLEDDRYQD